MREIVTEALVLAKEPIGEFDQRVTLFTERTGKVTAKVTSGRKITAKLSPHLEPFSFASDRLMPGRGERNGKSGYQVTDALGHGSLAVPDFALLRILRGVLPDGVREPELWEFVRNGEPTLRGVLRMLGFDPMHAVCAVCGAPDSNCFLFQDFEYRCRRCVGADVPRAAYVEFRGAERYTREI
jgi:recombinational DNA repair protein (RecF pathway)